MRHNAVGACLFTDKRGGYRKAFADFDPVKVARFTDKRVEKLLGDASIVRNRLKVNSAVTNAQAFLEVQKEFGTFCDYIWGFVGGRPIQNNFKKDGQVPATSPDCSSDLSITQSLRTPGSRSGLSISSGKTNTGSPGCRTSWRPQ